MCFNQFVTEKTTIMKFNYNKFLALPLLLAAGLTFFASCNKDVEDPQPVTTQPASGQSILQIINSDANFSILKAAIAKASTSTATSPSLSALLSDSTGVYTVFAPTDAAFQLSFQLLGIHREPAVPHRGQHRRFRPRQFGADRCAESVSHSGKAVRHPDRRSQYMPGREPGFCWHGG